MKICVQKAINVIAAAAVVCSASLFVSCDSKGEGPAGPGETVNVTLEKQLVYVGTGETAELAIVSGSGNYSVSSGDAAVATAGLDGSKIVLSGVAEGKTYVNVTDNATGQIATADVEVVSPKIYFETVYRFGELTLLIDAPQEYRDGVWIDLNADGECQENEKNITFGEKAKYAFNDKITIYGHVTVFDCQMMMVEKMDVTHNPFLVNLNIFANKLQEVDLTKAVDMVDLNISNNSDLTSVDLTKCTKLKTLSINDNKITNLDLSACTELEDLACIMTKVETITFGDNTKLTKLNAWNNEFKSIDISKMKDLDFLNLAGNQLKEIDLTNNTKLTNISLSNNPFEKMPDFSNQSDITELYLYECGFSNDDALKTIPNPEKITKLYMNNNYDLTTLDLSKFTSLTYVKCEQCNISGEDMQSLIDSLPDLTGKETAGKIYLVDLGLFASQKEKNSATKSQIAQLTAKNWKAWNVYSGAGERPYEGVDE